MKLKKRNTGSEISSSPQKSGDKKPVILYIMVLFIAAFLLMALSFLMHQRSNSEVLGALQNSVTAMQEIQATQEEVIHLQEQISALQKQLTEQNTQLQARTQSAENAQHETEALLALYTLQQQYSAQNYDDCRSIMQEMADNGLVNLLPQTSPTSGVTSPAQRYQQLKEAILNK